jgi:hypothetical protein
MDMKHYLTAVVIAASLLAVPASADNTLLLNCKCTASTINYGKAGIKPIACKAYNDFSAIVDFNRGTVQLIFIEEPEHPPRPAKISETMIRRSDEYGTEISINRIDGTFSNSSSIGGIYAYSGVCTKADAPKF